MKNEIDRLYQEYFSYLDSLDYDLGPDYETKIAHYKKLIGVIDVIENSSVSVFDLARKTHIYISEKFIRYFGWDTDEALSNPRYNDSKVHPDDLVIQLKAGLYFLKMAEGIEPEHRKDYKHITDYRMINKYGQYVRVIDQNLCLETDYKGNVWLGLTLTDISPDPDVISPARSRAINIKTGERYIFPPEQDDLFRQEHLSVREKEILQMISKGLISKEIADKLFISVNTVNTHRQRIIEKLNVSNTHEAISFARQLGLIL